MSYGHADKIAGRAGGDPAPGAEKPALYEREDVRRILAVRDVGALYRVLQGEGVTQRQIAELVGQSQSEVSEILAGRKVLVYDVLVRIAEGLGIPRELMGLSYGEPSAYGGQRTVPSPEEVAAMLRRHLIVLAPIAALPYHSLTRLAELLEHVELPGLSPVSLPSRLSGGPCGASAGSDPPAR
jgi:transcriptional regulator with XRE-family HTH domain